jgi:hypothetical protein
MKSPYPYRIVISIESIRQSILQVSALKFKKLPPVFVLVERQRKTRKAIKRQWKAP